MRNEVKKKFISYRRLKIRNILQTRAFINSWYPHSFQENVLFDNGPEIHLCWRNIIFTRQSVWASKKSYLGLRQSHEVSGNEQMQIVFITEEFLEVAIESWSEWDLSPRPLNSIQTLKPSDFSGHHIYKFISI